MQPQRQVSNHWIAMDILIGSRNSEYPWLFTVLRTERKIALRSRKFQKKLKQHFFIHLAPVVQTMDSAVHPINHYPADKH